MENIYETDDSKLSNNMIFKEKSVVPNVYFTVFSFWFGKTYFITLNKYIPNTFISNGVLFEKDVLNS